MKTKSGNNAPAHIFNAPVFKQVYALAEKRFFDPYDIGMSLTIALGQIFFAIDRVINWIYDRFIVWIVNLLSLAVRKLHTGSHWLYILWSIIGVMGIIIYFVCI